MKIASFKEESMEGIKVFKPIQYILSKTKGNGKAKMRVRLINSENGRTEELIPMLDLYVLGDIATKNEGYYLLGGDGRA